MLYFIKRSFIKELKTLFFPDYIFEISNNHQLEEQSILNLDKKIHEYMIVSNYSFAQSNLKEKISSKSIDSWRSARIRTLTK